LKRQDPGSVNRILLENGCEEYNMFI
jgi:hypothetical protein